MKRSAILAVFILSLGISAVAQKTAAKSASAPGKTTARAEDNFPRTRFDPTRDANADVKDGIATAVSLHKRVILDVGGEWCSWCRLMDRYLYENKGLGKLRDDNFVWIKINMSPENENRAFLAAYPTITGYPHLYVLDETGKLLVSQDTSELEDGQSYNLRKFTAFLKKWSPERPTEPIAAN